MDVVSAAVRVGTCPLAVVRIQVDPALREGALRSGRVVRAERRERFEDTRLRFVCRVVQIDRRYERGIQIVVVELRHLEHALPQLEISMKRREVVIDAVDEAHVDRRRNVGSIEC